MILSWFFLEMFREITAGLGSGFSFNAWSVLDWIRLMFQLAYFIQCSLQMVDGFQDSSEKG